MNDINNMLKNLNSRNIQDMINSPRGREVAAKLQGMSKQQAMSMLSNQYGVTQQQMQQIASHPEIANLLRR